MKVLMKFIYILACCTYLLSSTVAFGQQGKKQLYKWKDSTGKWHYSNIRPVAQDTKTGPVEVNVANDSKTIMFTKEIATENMDRSTAEKVDLVKRETDCKSAQAQMRTLSRHIQVDIDRSLMEQKISQDQYLQKKKIVARLEELAIDDSYYQSCLSDFAGAEKNQSLYRCVVEEKDATTCIFPILNDINIDSITAQ